MNLDTTQHTAAPRLAFGRFPVPFYIGAAFDILLGLDLVVAGGWIAAQAAPAHPEVFGIATATVLQILGVVLMIYGADTALAARSRGLLRKLLPVIVGANWAWVVLSAAFLLVDGQALSGAGIALVVIVAAITGVLAWSQQRALRG